MGNNEGKKITNRISVFYSPSLFSIRGAFSDVCSVSVFLPVYSVRVHHLTSTSASRYRKYIHCISHWSVLIMSDTSHSRRWHIITRNHLSRSRPLPFLQTSPFHASDSHWCTHRHGVPATIEQLNNIRDLIQIYLKKSSLVFVKNK